MITEHSAITEPVHRLEVFTGPEVRRDYNERRQRCGGRATAWIVAAAAIRLAPAIAKHRGCSIEGGRTAVHSGGGGCCACSATTESAMVRAGCRHHRGRDRGRDCSDRPRRRRRNGSSGTACAESRRVIGPTGAVRVMVATKPVDFRKGAEGLAALVRETMKSDPFSGAVYVFRAKRADRVKLIYWDGTGVCLFAKRLEDGKFRWPNVQDGVMRLSAAEFSALLEGLDWRRVHAARETPAPVQPG